MAMTVPTLGFEDPTTLRKEEIALIQITEAISLFTAQRFLPSVTLAGAAEEILGNLLIRKGERPTVKDAAKAIVQLRETLGISAMDGKSEGKIVDGWNESRNALKHLIGAEDVPMTLNLCDEAFWMIRRALDNAKRLGLDVPNSQEFENWVVVNVTT